jgi:hypothetical protein
MLKQEPLRFKMSPLGAIRCPRLANRKGVIVGRGQATHHVNAVRVIFDGSKSPTTLHRTYVELDLDQAATPEPQHATPEPVTSALLSIASEARSPGDVGISH